MFKFIKEQAGFNLIEVMVAGAIVAGLGLVAANIFQKQNEANRYNRLVSDVNSFHSQLRTVVSDVRNCNATFAAAGGAVTNNPGQNIDSLKMCCPGGVLPCSVPKGNTACTNVNNSTDNNIAILSGNVRVLAEVNRNIPMMALNGITATQETHPDIRLASMSLVYRNPVTNTYTPVSSMTGTAETKLYELRLQYELLRTKGGVTSIQKTIPVGAKFSSTGAFQGCVSADSSTKDSFTREVCEGINAQSGGQILVRWEKGEEGIEKCVRVDTQTTQTCPAGQAFQGYRADGTPDCKVPLNIANPGQIINPGQSNNCAAGSSIQFVRDSNNQVRVICSGTTGGTSGGTSTGGTTGCTPNNWSTGTWGTCNALTLTQTRTVGCLDAGCGCTSPTPASTQSCTCGSWTPNVNPANLRSGHCVVQSNNCGQTNEVYGTCTTMPSYTCMENAFGPGCHY